MPDGFGSNEIMRSRILGMGLEDTPYNPAQISQGMQGANPEQMQALFQNPQAREQFQHFGIDPSQMMQHIRQSPFLPNQFMQQHPGLGGAFTGAAANLAMTPEAPMVSGAGSGISRAFQGMMGGPEMLRHYQLQQMMAPMGMTGAMMPMYGEQRRQAIEQGIVSQLQDQQRLAPERMQLEREKAEALKEKDEAHRPYFDPQTATTYLWQPGQAPTTNVGDAGVTPGGPGQQAGYYPQVAPTQRVADVSQARDPQKAANAGLAGAKADEQRQETKAGMPGAKVGAMRSKSAADQAHAALFGAEAGQVAAGHGLGGSAINPQQRLGQGLQQGLGRDEELALKELTGVYADPKLSDQQKAEYAKNVKMWLDGRKQSQVGGYQTTMGQQGPGAQASTPAAIAPQAAPAQGAPKPNTATPAPAAGGGAAAGQVQYATDPNGQLHKAAPGVPLPQGWKSAPAPTQ